jgi:CheY-like chemotaxis protein
MNLALIIIDDSELDRFIIQRIVRHIDKSLSVYSFSNAQQALEYIRSNEFNNQKLFKLILLDLRMPVMNGFQFIEEFEKLPLEIQEKHKIIVLSTTRNPSDISRLLSYRAVASMLEKPITKERLQSIISELSFSTQQNAV